MILSEPMRAALRGYWLGEPLPAELARLLGQNLAEGPPTRDEVLAYLAALAGEAAGKTRRLVLTYSPGAVARLVELLHGESDETARKAAVDLLRLFHSSAEDEVAEEAARSASEMRRLTSGMTDEDAVALLELLDEYEVMSRAGAPRAALAVAAEEEEGGEGEG
jgi:hypothetical protein